MEKKAKKTSSKTDMEALLWLLKPLRLEEKQGFLNKAVAGGIAKWLPLLREKLVSQAGISTQMCNSLLSHLEGYTQASPDERRIMVDKVYDSVSGKKAAISPKTVKTSSDSRADIRYEPIHDFGMAVQYLKGVGPKRAALLAKIGIRTVMDLLTHYPRDWQDRTSMEKIHAVKNGTQTAVCGKVVGKQTFTIRRGLNVTKVILDDGTGQIAATWFNQPFMRERFSEGQAVLAFGKVEFYRGWQIMNPDYEILEDETENTIHTGRIVPLYPLTERISQRVMRSIQYALLQQLPTSIPGVLPEKVVSEQAFLDAASAYREIHFPSVFPALDQARRRLVFEELFLQQIAVARMRRDYNQATSKSLMVRGNKLKTFLSALPFTLTDAQDRALKSIFDDLQKETPMHRLLQGDVGSGKTVVAAAAMLAAVDSGMQAAIMAPTEILAVQHYWVMQRQLESSGVTIALLTSGVRAAEKRRILAELEQGHIDILVGTHALTQETVIFKTLGLAVVDEQHRFGVEQRAMLRAKGDQPHVLVMTATPIPRTLALTVYGDLDVTILDELPPGRVPIQTEALTHQSSGRAYEAMKREIHAGRQGYVIFPLIDESEKMDLKALTKEYVRLEQHVFKGFTMGLLHGRLSAVEKDDVMTKFKTGEIQILASTTVVEVGVDVPNATMMIIENADRFGLAALHQLRGRIGRGRHASFCFLIADPHTEEGRARMRIMCTVKDGFRLAEEDLALRGPGEFFGLRQHGLPDLKLANLVRDADQIETACTYARQIIEQDRDMAMDENRFLREAYFALYADREGRAKSG